MEEEAAVLPIGGGELQGVESADAIIPQVHPLQAGEKLERVAGDARQAVIVKKEVLRGRPLRLR